MRNALIMNEYMIGLERTKFTSPAQPRADRLSLAKHYSSRKAAPVWGRLDGTKNAIILLCLFQVNRLAVSPV